MNFLRGEHEAACRTDVNGHFPSCITVLSHYIIHRFCAVLSRTSRLCRMWTLSPSSIAMPSYFSILLDVAHNSSPVLDVSPRQSELPTGCFASLPSRRMTRAGAARTSFCVRCERLLDPSGRLDASAKCHASPLFSLMLGVLLRMNPRPGTSRV